MHEPSKILLLRLSSIGDIVLTTPLIRALRRSFPQAKIDFVVKTNFAELVAHNPHLNTVHHVNVEAGWSGLVQLGRHLRNMRYDAVLDLHRNFRTSFLTRICSASLVGRYQKPLVRRWLFVRFKAATMQRIPPVYLRYFEAAESLKVQDEGGGTELFWNEAYEAEAQEVLHKAGWNEQEPLLCLAPGAGYFTKRWPAEYFAEIARQLHAKRADFSVAILGGAQDHDLGKFMRAQCERPILDLTGQCSVLASAAILKRSRLLLANDSGLMHIAEAVGTPVLAIFGSTTRELGFFPQRPSSRVLEHLALSCRPCSHLGYQACPRGHFKCMREITPPQVLVELEKVLLARAD